MSECIVHPGVGRRSCIVHAETPDGGVVGPDSLCVTTRDKMLTHRPSRPISERTVKGVVCTVHRQGASQSCTVQSAGGATA